MLGSFALGITRGTSEKLRMCSSRSTKLAAVVAIVVIMGSAGPVVRAEVPLLESDVLPILTKNCMGCHGRVRKEGGLDLRTVPAMLADGESGPAIVAGDLNKGELWQRVASDEMPEGDDREKLSPAEN